MLGLDFTAHKTSNQAMEMVLVDVVSRGTGGLPCALLGDILWLSRVRRTR